MHLAYIILDTAMPSCYQIKQAFHLHDVLLHLGHLNSDNHHLPDHPPSNQAMLVTTILTLGILIASQVVQCQKIPTITSVSQVYPFLTATTSKISQSEVTATSSSLASANQIFTNGSHQPQAHPLPYSTLSRLYGNHRNLPWQIRLHRSESRGISNHVCNMDSKLDFWKTSRNNGGW